MEEQVVDEKKRKKREAQKRYRQKNREKINENNKQYRLDNKEKVNETNKQYRLKNKKKIKEYRLENREKIKEYHLNNKDRAKHNKLKRKYDITLDDYNKMLQKQNGSCAICFVKEEQQRNKVLVVDHNHLTGAVRSLLCNNCNRGIGLLKENQEVILRAADYLKKFSATLTDEQVAAM